MEDTYLPPEEWRQRVETWRQVCDWYVNDLGRDGVGAYAPDPSGGAIEEIRARMDEKTLRELVLPWRKEHGQPFVS
jgi:hypothetical protein